MKYAGIEVTKVTTINQPVRVAIFLVSIDDDPSQRRPGKRADTQRGSAPRAIARAVATTSRGMRNTWAVSGHRAATGADGLEVAAESYSAMSHSIRPVFTSRRQQTSFATRCAPISQVALAAFAGNRSPTT